jgi:RHS repeat-associated protein
VQFYPWGYKWGDTTNGSLFQVYAKLLWYDPETNGYQAQFRYYIPRHSRWLTPDPAGKGAVMLDDPQTWNMYVYTRNNPTTRTDPTGLYDFKSPCEKSDKQCSADFKAFQKEFKNSLKDIKQARNSFVKGSEERARLDSVLKTYGKAGDNNGVTVTTGDLPGRAAAATVGTAVTFDLSKNPNVNIMAINAGHEGTHVMDNLDPRSQTSPLDTFQQEYRGYQTSAWVGEGLGLDVSSGRFSIYSTTSGFSDTGVTDLILDRYQPVLDPPVHDPWDSQ